MNDEKLLKKKLTERTDAKFKKEFCNKFENEFPKEKPLFLFEPKYALSFCLAIGLMISYSLNRSEKQVVLAENDVEMMQNYELLSELDEELINLTDEEWEIILAES